MIVGNPHEFAEPKTQSMITLKLPLLHQRFYLAVIRVRIMNGVFAKSDLPWIWVRDHPGLTDFIDIVSIP